MLIVTGVDFIYENYGKENAEPIRNLKVGKALDMIENDQLGTGSMAPKVRALVDFIKNGREKAIICSPENFREALQGKSA